MEGRSCEVLAAVGEYGAASGMEGKKSARFLEIITGRLHPGSESGEGAKGDTRVVKRGFSGSFLPPCALLCIFPPFF